MKNVLLIGLGRFGSHIAKQLHSLGHEIMAVDKEERRVEAALPYVTNAQTEHRRVVVDQQIDQSRKHHRVNGDQGFPLYLFLLFHKVLLLSSAKIKTVTEALTPCNNFYYIST